MEVYDPEIDFPEAWKLLQPFMLNDETLISIRNSMSRELQNGLLRDMHARSSIPCLLSYVQHLPTGHERGRFLALEMWPTNCRIMLVKFSSEKDIYMSSKCVIVPHTVAASRGTTLFNFLAHNIAIFVRDKKVEKDNLPMGIAFAFELNKLALDVGILVRWTKGYGAQGAVGKNIVKLLQNALDEYKDIRINLNSIVNISAGTLMALAWSYPNCKIGLIVGTSTNAAYVEQTDACQMYEGNTKQPLMIINTEWRNFGANGHLDFIRNEFDKLVDAVSNEPGMKFYEKCISTLYLGELVRLIVVRLMKMGVIFKGASMDYFDIQWKMEMKSIMAIESDPPNVYTSAHDNLPLGFTFSFPCKHIGIDQGILVTWTKGFKSEGVVNKNVVEMLREAISRRGDFKVDIVAILNDTTGTLMSCAFQKQNCKIGMILGTGTNACYVEKTSNVEMFPAYQTSTKPHMIINCEWGAFGENGELDFVRTSFDKAVDRESLYPTKQVFEKCISGKYMGELVRHIVVELMDKGVLFKDATSQILREREKFDTRFLSEIESDKPGRVRNACKVMDELGVRGTSEEDLLCLRHICQTISTRSAKLAACGLVSLIKKTKVKDIAVGIDGSVYCFHPHYHRLLLENMKLLLKGSAKFELSLSKDGSGRGAALTAAVYTRRPPNPPKALPPEKQSSSCPLKASAPAGMPTVRRFIQKVIWTFRHF
ncbi:PREDICTED: uncharacterized protein LOC108620838 [Drosophila arizonae]|uniref:hexokinase n=1 Tax=Drosophila arizonae TaxID=7263 RepID=A0ABM1Q1H2_DROAR|nr:PREDICTED: uncharacterized protein LOC108620838 [Drosophila arizonae]